MGKKSPIIIIAILFFIFGFVTWLNASLIPFLQVACELNNFQSFFVTFSFYIAYFFLAIPSSYILKKLGYKQAMAAGLKIMALGAIIFIPAATYRSYWMFLSGLFFLGAGLSLLQTASNPYVAVLGPIESAAKRISIMGVFNKLAGIIAPVLIGTFILKDISEKQLQIDQLALQDMETRELLLRELANSCKIPYLCIGLVLFLLSIWVRKSTLPEIDFEQENKQAHTRFRIREYPRLIGGILAIFFYVGAEVISIDTLIKTGLDAGVSDTVAKLFPSIAMVSLIIGYFIGILVVPKYISQQKALVYSASLCLILSILVVAFPFHISVFILLAMGLGNAMIWPAVWGLAIDGLGEHTPFGSSLLIMAIAGGALLPLLYGYLNDLWGNPAAYSVLLPCYLIIGIYAISAKKQRK